MSGASANSIIIFDRYNRRGILQAYYFASIARRVEQGGALLITAGEGEAGLDGMHRTALAAILPSQPTGNVIRRAYRPAPTQLGQRHPVVRGLPSPERWGRWSMQVEARASGGQAVLAGADGRPLLVLDRAGQGRVAQLCPTSPGFGRAAMMAAARTARLLRRLAHWLMQEPELEDERLTLDPARAGLRSSVPPWGRAGRSPPSGARVARASMNRAWPLSRRGRGGRAGFTKRSGDSRAFGGGPLIPRGRRARVRSGHPGPYAEASGGGVFMTGENGQRLPEVRRVARGGRMGGND